MLRWCRPLTVMVSMAAFSWACAPAPEPFEETPLDTEVVGGGVDAELSTEEDRKGAARNRAGGVLPGDFPSDLPLPGEYTIVDFSQSAGSGDDPVAPGPRYLVVHTAQQESAVRENLPGRLSALGWTVETTDDGFAITREGRRVRWIVSDTRPGTRIEIHY